MNVAIHHFEKDFNFGLAPTACSYDAKTMLKLISEKLKNFHLDLATDIVVSSNDGVAVKKKMGQISPIINQLGYSHA